MSHGVKQPLARVPSDPHEAKSGSRRNRVFRTSSVAHRFRNSIGKFNEKENQQKIPDTELSPRRRKKKSGSVVELRNLPNGFASLLFDDKSGYLVDYYLLKTGTRFKKFLRPLIEISISETCASEFIFGLMSLEFKKNGTAPLDDLPQFVLAKQRGKMILTAQAPTTFKTWMAPHGLVGVRCCYLIKKIDNAISKSVMALLDTITEPTDFKRSQTNPKHPFSAYAGALFPGIDPSLLLTKVLATSAEIMEIACTLTKDEIPLEIVELLASYDDFAKENQEKISLQRKMFFWCIVYPLFNVHPLFGRKKSKMSADGLSLFALCVIVISNVMFPSKVESLFENEMCDEEMTAKIAGEFEVLRKHFLVHRVKGLSDTILSICGSDNSLAINILTTELIDHLSEVWNELIKDPSTYRDLLMLFIPFIRCGTNETGGTPINSSI